MSQSKTPNPNASPQELITQWERGFDAFANRVMGTEGFSQVMNDLQKLQLAGRQLVTELSTRQLTTLNMPTREDVLQLAEGIADLSRRLERIEERLELEAKPTTTAKKPPRTKKPPKAKKKD